MLDVKYVFGEDWEGIYINNVLADETHNFRFERGFKIICKYINEVESVDSIQFTTYEVVDLDWLENECGFPKIFEDIPSCTLDEWT